MSEKIKVLLSEEEVDSRIRADRSRKSARTMQAKKSI